MIMKKMTGNPKPAAPARALVKPFGKQCETYTGYEKLAPLVREIGWAQNQ